jgi:hypothetical protein
VNAIPPIVNLEESGLPDYIEARFRRPAPVGVRVVDGSTPVVSFGDLRKARIATLAINPSYGEFLYSRGDREREGVDRRLETLRSLRCEDLAGAPREVIQKAFSSCNSYFTRRPYAYFGKLETVLRHLNASFYDGSACHLDLVQWATKPRWIELDSWEREGLLQADVPFLKSQLLQEHLRLVVVNGSGVRDQYERFFGISLREVQFPPHTHLEVSGGPSISFFQGRTSYGQHVVGWNINLQSSFGVSRENVRAIAEHVARIVSSPKP